MVFENCIRKTTALLVFSIIFFYEKATVTPAIPGRRRNVSETIIDVPIKYYPTLPNLAHRVPGIERIDCSHVKSVIFTGRLMRSMLVR